jgi:hypothetical protein
MRELNLCHDCRKKIEEGGGKEWETKEEKPMSGTKVKENKTVQNV